MLASQLPESSADALAVLECVRELVVTFLKSDAPEPAKATVITLIRDCPDLSVHAGGFFASRQLKGPPGI